jgi:hypothetical protein
MSQNTTNITNTLKTITTTCGGVGSWLKNALSNAGPGSGSIQSLPPYSSSSPPSPSSFAFPGILQKGGGRRRKARRTNKRSKTTRRVKRTRKH